MLNIRGYYQIDNITQEFVNELADIDPIFKPFKDDKGLAVSLRPKLRPKNFNEGGLATNLEREMEEALGLPPRPKYVSTAVQDTANLLDKEIAEAKTAGISQESPTLSDLGNIVIDFTPVIGDIKGGIEGAELIFEELKKEEPNYVLIGVVGGAGVLGLIPGIGDGAQKLIMKGAKRFRKKELSPELMESLTLKEKEIVEDLNKKTVEKPNTTGEEIADFIAESLRNNKLEYITDDILTGLGNDGHRRLTQHYIDGNVGMDLPMDFESTMARAADQGFTELRYHGSNIKDLDFFFGQGEKRGAGMFNSPDVFKALTYETPNGQTYSLLMRPLPEDTPKVDVEGATWGNLDEPSIAYNRNKLSPDVRTGPRMDRVAEPLDTFVPQAKANITTDMFMRKASDLGYPGATIENVVDRGAYTPRNLSLEEGQNIRTKASIPSETQARTDTTGIRTLFGRFDPRLQNLKNINMYQGGMAMNDQTQMAFALGGEAETVDPVSGNDVPPGSLPEEVRDDIDARLSEGEYVVPADVVRYFGVKFFEDLRTQAKMGLQQMDADGRIGGDPIPPEDSMDVAELKEELSKSDMYAGGLTDGGGLDTFIDDASRSPMVNGRMRANGATVKMAVGGLAVGNYGDVTKVDGIIQKLMTAANKDPALMEKLASKGIMINKTGADKKSAEMKQANKPEEPLKAAEGVSVESDPFDFDSYGTLGGRLFESANIDVTNKQLDDTFLNKNGTIQQIILIAPDGTEIPVAWNTTMPIPPGFTRKATDTLDVEPTKTDVQPETYVRSPVVSSRESDNGGDSSPVVTPTSTGKGFNFGNPKDYSDASLTELNEALRKSRNATKLGAVAAVAFGPLGSLIGIATRAHDAIVQRRIENELQRRANEEKVDDLNKLKEVISDAQGSNKLKSLITSLKINPQLKDDKIEDSSKNIISVIADSIFRPFADSITESVNKKRDDKKSIDYTKDYGTAIDAQVRQALQDTANVKLTDKQKRDEAAQAAATAAQSSRARQINEGMNRKDFVATGNRQLDEQRALDLVSGRIKRVPQGGYQYSGPASGIDSYRADREKAYEQQRTEAVKDFFGGFFGNEGGLLTKPAAKKQKKRTTQRRKGLGTRP